MVPYRFRRRGPDQSRTGVEAFAELCLTTRPQDHAERENNVMNVIIKVCV